MKIVGAAYDANILIYSRLLFNILLQRLKKKESKILLRDTRTLLKQQSRRGSSFHSTRLKLFHQLHKLIFPTIFSHSTAEKLKTFVTPKI